MAWQQPGSPQIAAWVLCHTVWLVCSCNCHFGLDNGLNRILRSKPITNHDATVGGSISIRESLVLSAPQPPYDYG
ncbi:hypothetical protein BKA93DRAFT_353000 [Sparassis latifolia]